MLRAAIVTCFLVCALASPIALPLDGTVLTSSIHFNEYIYYFFNSTSSGDVTITTTVTDGSDIGVWTWVGTGYNPVDGKSDWDMGAIRSYPSELTVANIAPGQLYYVGVQGIGQSESYSISASRFDRPWDPPTTIEINDMPYDAASSATQYTDFNFTAIDNSNYTVQVLVTNGHSTVYLMASRAPTLPRRGTLTPWSMHTTVHGQWESLSCNYLRKGMTLNFSVESSSEVTFRVRVTNMQADSLPSAT